MRKCLGRSLKLFASLHNFSCICLHEKSLVSVCLLFTQVSVVNIFYSSDKFKASGERARREKSLKKKARESMH